MKGERSWAILTRNCPDTKTGLRAFASTLGLGLEVQWWGCSVETTKGGGAVLLFKRPSNQLGGSLENGGPIYLVGRVRELDKTGGRGDQLVWAGFLILSDLTRTF